MRANRPFVCTHRTPMTNKIAAIFALSLSLGFSSVALADGTTKNETEHSTETKKDVFDNGTTTKTKSKKKHVNPDGSETTTETTTKTTTKP